MLVPLSDGTRHLVHADRVVDFLLENRGKLVKQHEKRFGPPEP